MWVRVRRSVLNKYRLWEVLGGCIGKRGELQQKQGTLSVVRFYWSLSDSEWHFKPNLNSYGWRILKLLDERMEYMGPVLNFTKVKPPKPSPTTTAHRRVPTPELRSQ